MPRISDFCCSLDFYCLVPNPKLADPNFLLDELSGCLDLFIDGPVIVGESSASNESSSDSL